MEPEQTNNKTQKPNQNTKQTKPRQQTVRGFKDELDEASSEFASTGSMCAIACLDSRGS